MVDLEHGGKKPVMKTQRAKEKKKKKKPPVRKLFKEAGRCWTVDLEHGGKNQLWIYTTGEKKTSGHKIVKYKYKD